MVSLVLAALAVSVVGAFAVPSLRERLWPVDHRVADTAAPEHGVPASVSEVAWRWRPPGNEVVDTVLPVPGGAVAVLDSGVVALDGPSGEERWHYRRSDAIVRSAGVTPDGAGIAVSYTDPAAEEGDPGETVVFLDGRTGRLRAEYEPEALPQEPGPSRFAHVSDEVFLAPGEDPLAVEAFALVDGEPVWSHEGGGAGEAGPLVTTGDAVAATAVLTRGSGTGEEHVLVAVGVDAARGDLLWEEEYPVSDFGDETVEVRYEPSWEALHLGFVEPGGGPVHLLVDPSTGRVLARDSRYPFWGLEDGYVVRTPDSGGGDRVRYSHVRFDGSTSGETVAGNAVGDADLYPGLATGEAVLRLRYLGDDGVTRAPVTVEALPWDGEPYTIDPGLGTAGWQAGDGTVPVDTYPPALLAVPGAVVVLDKDTWATELVGLT
ncbi:PQQ-binding-like beta-propeller repeat protein [Nocardiopsis sp. LOL_012]|uniref:outer membrane protein assembly factor BamB family protein n=1 Tax=Nocardiopsis sp. LOL_012 TaxID=3345409 RepID=UPI003A8829AF